MYKILLVEDDVVLATVLKEFFVMDKLFAVSHAADGEEAISLYNEEHPHLIVLDVVLPKKNGFEVIAEIRAKDYLIPILMMTGTEIKSESVIKGYELGAFNYIMKPVLPKALLAQIKTLLHLSYGTENYTVGNYNIIIQNQLVKINDDPVLLREKDMQVLSILLKGQGQIVPRQQILKKVWDTDDYSKNNSLDSSISRIRKAFVRFPGLILEPVYAEGYILRKN